MIKRTLYVKVEMNLWFRGSRQTLSLMVGVAKIDYSRREIYLTLDLPLVEIKAPFLNKLKEPREWMNLVAKLTRIPMSELEEDDWSCSYLHSQRSKNQQEELSDE